MRARARWMAVLVAGLLLVSCGKTAPAAVPTATPAGAAVTDTGATATVAAPVATDIPAATATIFARATSTPSNVEPADATAVAATSVALLLPTATPDANGDTFSMQGETAVVTLMEGTDGPFYASLAMGMTQETGDEGARTYHPLSVFQKTSTGIQKITEYDFKDGQIITNFELIPTYQPGKAFFTVSGGVGAHSSFGQVYSFDGKTITLEYTANSDAGGNALQMVDVNGDGALDAVGDATDYYVFCYACGVRAAYEEVYSWDGTAFVQQKPAPSNDTHIQAAYAAAQIDRWVVVRSELAQAGAPLNPVDAWTVALLSRVAAARKPTADAASPFMSALLDGDYDGAVSVLRRTDPAALVDLQAAGFPAELRDFGEVVIENVVRLSSTVLATEELPSARFLRGWAQTLKDPRDAAGRTDLEAVAGVDPFYAAVLEAVDKR